jgi:polysaccharide deacetylase 2 family uncharacterized protein YibQ
MNRYRWISMLAIIMAFAACSSSLSIRDARLQTLCRLEGHSQRLDLMPRGPNALGLRIVATDIGNMERRVRAHLPPNTPTGFQHIQIEAPAPKIAIVIDDLGLHPTPPHPFRALGQPLTYAVLVDSPHASLHLKWLTQHEASILIHLPMEPLDSEEMTFDGFFTLSESSHLRIERLKEQLADVPNAVGWSNHMGSRFTTDTSAIRQIITHTPKHMMILDSRTTADSQITPLAQSMGHPIATRQVFLDNIREPEAISAQLTEALMIARRDGQVVAIGHPYKETATALALFLEEHGDNVHFVTIDKVSHPQADSDWLRRCQEKDPATDLEP